MTAEIKLRASQGIADNWRAAAGGADPLAGPLPVDRYAALTKAVLAYGVTSVEHQEAEQLAASMARMIGPPGSPIDTAKAQVNDLRAILAERRASHWALTNTVIDWMGAAVRGLGL